MDYYSSLIINTTLPQYCIIFSQNIWKPNVKQTIKLYKEVYNFAKILFSFFPRNRERKLPN